MTKTPHDVRRAQQVLLEIARQSAGGEIEGKTKLFKTFYFAHLFYATNWPGYLTEWPMVRMPNGPGIDQFDLLISGLRDEKALQCEPVKIGPFTTTRYRAVGTIEADVPLTREEIQAIREAVEFTADKSAEHLSELTHEYSRAWNESDKMGQELSIYKDLLGDETCSRLEEKAAQVSNEVDRLFGG
jgi:hypothetical protein